MKNMIKILSVWSIGVSLFACSDLTFGDKFLGDQPESSGATLDSMFNSKANADKVLTQAYCYCLTDFQPSPEPDTTNWE